MASTQILPPPDDRHRLAVARLRLEATLLRHGLTFAVNVPDCVLTIAGGPRIALQPEASGGIGVHISSPLGTVPHADDELSVFVESVNGRVSETRVAFDPVGLLEASWVKEFPRVFDATAVLHGLASFAKTLSHIAPELRERFFLHPSQLAPALTALADSLEDTAPPESEPPLRLTRELHEHLLTAIVELFGEAVEIDNACSPEHGLVAYRFRLHGAVCLTGFQPFNETSAVLTVSARLGRIYRGFARALRWLAHNRGFNTVGLAFQEASAANHELWIASNRNTLAGDADGIRFELQDFCQELGKTVAGLRHWFPQMMDGEALEQFEAMAQNDEGVAFALTSPRAALQAIESSADKMESSAMLYCYITRWLGDWERNLRVLDSAQIEREAEHDPELRERLPGVRLRALRALGRHREIAAEVLSVIEEPECSSPSMLALRAECLCATGHDEEALETLRSAELDGDAEVEFLRAAANMKLGRADEAVQAFAAYENAVGADWIGRKKLAALAAENSAN